MPAARWLLLLLYAVRMEECAAWEPQGGRGYWQQAVNTVSLSVCLFVCYCIRRPGLCSFRSCSLTTSALWVWSIIQSCQDTSWLTIAALNQYFPPSRTGLFHWQEFKNGQALIEKKEKMLKRIDGRDPSHFSNSPQSETDFRQLVWTNLQVYWLKNSNNPQTTKWGRLQLIMFGMKFFYTR